MPQSDCIQQRWRDGFLLGYDALVFRDGKVTLASVGKTYSSTNKNNYQIHWSPLCDTSINGLAKYNDDLWAEIQLYNPKITCQDEIFLCGEGAMGNEGFVASVDKNNVLNWALFSTFSNPIYQIALKGRDLVCYGTSDIAIHIDTTNPLKLEVKVMPV